MSEIDINSLPYPMFKTTPEEKEILRQCLPFLENHEECYICIIIRLGLHLDNRSLTDKIDESLGLYSGLGSYLINTSKFIRGLDIFLIRIIWINKLLEYTGE